MEETEVTNKSPPYVVLFIAEFFGTAVLMYIGCMGCIITYPTKSAVPGVSFGIGIAAAIQAIGHISGAHLNPAVSLGVLILGKMTVIEFFVYIVAQYIGAIAGYGLLYAMMPAWVKGPVAREDVGYCDLAVQAGMTPIKALGVETIISWILMFGIAGLFDTKNKFKNDSTPLRVAFLVMGLIFAALPLTGAGLNPARAIPSALFPGRWADHWVYHVGPFLGMILAATMYRFIFESEERLSLYSHLSK